MEVKKEHVDKVFDLAKLSLAFARVNRNGLHEDGIRPETDTDHTFTLLLTSCSLADTFYKNILDIGLISQYCTIHDLVEVYAGDANTFLNVSEQFTLEKIKKEKDSFERLKKEFEPEFVWATNLIERYEKQEDREARFVKFVDKILPEINHLSSNFSYILKSGLDKNYYIEFHNNKLKKLILYKDEFPEVFYIYQKIWDKSLEAYNKYL